ncbi:MAG: LysR family transcriptional regulator [Lachnospiraceae bacterium]|nr:LysR family transcriptional regulator [Lachnospiraceae bacterium]
MIPNYHYFLALAEECSISRAAERLFVSHQALSKYLKGLETRYGVTLFHRKPRLSLTPAGQQFYESLRQLELLESNLENQLLNYHDSDTGSLRIGATQGRFRILIPELLVRFKALYPHVELDTVCADSNSLREMLLSNRLDFMLTALPADGSSRLESTLLMTEKLYLIISDNMLRHYFPGRFPACKKAFRKGVHLEDFQHVPFILNQKGYSSRDIVDTYAMKNNLSLNCIQEIVQADIHYLLSAKDYAASFCFSMFLPGISAANRLDCADSKLNIFPVAGFDTANPVRLLYLKGRLFPAYGQALISLIQEICRPFMQPPAEIG